MVTFIDGEADKNLYRHFKIRQIKGNSDIDSMKEVARRRSRHFDDPTSPGLRGASWGRPDLIIVDGGILQVKAFTSILHNNKVNIPVVGIAKHPDRLIVGNEKIKLIGLSLNLVSRIRDEAHRFARVYHHKLVSTNMLN
jgi:excinuclease ABC subunit C